MSNGPAFPYQPREVSNPRAGDVESSGMSLRDYFAGQAPLPCPPFSDRFREKVALRDGSGSFGDKCAEVLAEMAYQFADAMLAELAERAK